MDILELEERYLKAKEAYYNGEPLVSDDEFDRLEEELREMGSDVVNLVGSTDRNYKHKHLSPMLSLNKAQAAMDGTPPVEQMVAWFSTFPKDMKFEATPKYDGNAVNLIYRNGKLEKAVTRGDKEKGKDVTNKIIRKVPLWLDGVTNDVEVRGEVVMDMETFNSKYSHFKNPRNFVAGVLNKDEVQDDLLNEITFMALEVRIHDGDYDYPENTQSWLWTHGFNKKHSFSVNFKPSEFVKVYNQMKDYRENTSPFQLDGFVIKSEEKTRRSYGESGHSPNWAIAIKFPPKEATTRVASIRWSVGTTGEITPVVEMDPVDLDGTTVRNAAAFNAGNILRQGLFPGAIVAIAKSGDIIPQVVKVITPNFTGTLPGSCPCGKGGTNLDGIHLWCTSEECGTKMMKKFIVGLGVFRMDKFGGVTRTTLYNTGYDEIWKIFDKDLFNEEKLVSTGAFKHGKTLTSLLEEVEKLKKVTLPQIILSLGFDGVGAAAAKELAKYIRGQEHSFAGLEKAAVTGFDIGTSKREKIEKLVSVISARGIEVEEEIIVKDGIGYEMTGSPKSSGFNVKSELEKFLLSHGFVHTGLKEAKVLLTDSIGSSSSKMAQARKLGVEIHEYSTFIEKIKNGEQI
jgi:DNA ligase (NAD+)